MQSEHYYSNSLNEFCRKNAEGRIFDWIATLSNDDLRNLKRKIEVLISPLPIGISSHDGFDLNYLAFAAESQKRRRRVVNLPWNKREGVLIEISQSIEMEIENRRDRFKAISAAVCESRTMNCHLRSEE